MSSSRHTSGVGNTLHNGRWVLTTTYDGRTLLITVVWRQVEHEAIWTSQRISYKYSGTRVSPSGRLEKDINAATESAVQTSHSNYGPILGVAGLV